MIELFGEILHEKLCEQDDYLVEICKNCDIIQYAI